MFIGLSFFFSNKERAESPG